MTDTSSFHPQNTRLQMRRDTSGMRIPDPLNLQLRRSGTPTSSKKALQYSFHVPYRLRTVSLPFWPSEVPHPKVNSSKNPLFLEVPTTPPRPNHFRGEFFSPSQSLYTFQNGALSTALHPSFFCPRFNQSVRDNFGHFANGLLLVLSANNLEGNGSISVHLRLV